MNGTARMTRAGRTLQWLLAAVIAAWPVRAEIAPAFHLESATWNATDVVIASEDGVIDGRLTVRHVWKGRLRVGDALILEELDRFRDPAERMASDDRWSTERENPHTLAGEELLLFLVERSPSDPDESPRWEPALFDDHSLSMLWIEGDDLYGFVTGMLPSHTELFRLDEPYSEVQSTVAGLVEASDALDVVALLSSPAARAEEAARYLGESILVRRRAAEILSRTGSEALPHLRARLADDSLDDDADIVRVVGQAGDEALSPLWIEVLNDELTYWQRLAPRLAMDWWDDAPPGARARYGVLYSTLFALRQAPVPEAADVVRRLRDFWRSQPQLDDPSGLSQIGQECDYVLQALGASSSLAASTSR